MAKLWKYLSDEGKTSGIWKAGSGGKKKERPEYWETFRKIRDLLSLSSLSKAEHHLLTSAAARMEGFGKLKLSVHQEVDQLFRKYSKLKSRSGEKAPPPVIIRRAPKKGE
jgi:hypothetical protein